MDIDTRPRQRSDVSAASTRERNSIASQTSLPSIAEGFPQIKDSPLPHARTLKSVAPKRFCPTDNTIIKLDGKALREYIIDGVSYTMQEGRNENVARVERFTADKRRLLYELNVIQQPIRARACGSGPRSSADRRPVDPPPVIQLKVMEGDPGRETDITMNYEATFVLYASLEVGRPIAGARMYTQNQAPVLTGVPVAGTAYLDKPHPAAYFIFPDLSVRHEGWYNLRFCLFEGVKRASDADLGQQFTPIEARTTEDGKDPWAGMVNRMEVRSLKFQVFSAKKFPGLKGSTDLSRLIADQGCRVRIRREVRQRKRPTKDDVSDDEDQRSEQTPTPSDAARSMSRNSHHGSAFYRQYLSTPDCRFSSDSNRLTNTLAPMRPPQSPVDRTYSNSGTYMPPPSSIPQTFNIPPPDAMLQRPPVPAYPSDISLPPIHTTVPNIPSYDPSRKLWNIPENSSTQKRSYSPLSTGYINQSAPIKDGARPDTLPLVSPQPLQPTDLGHGLGQGIMEPDDEEGGSDSDSSLLEGDYTYKRADGRTGSKTNVHLAYYRCHGR